MARSALLNIMVQAAYKAGRSLTRDFGEIENLQVSRKGPADFVSNADRQAEEVIFEELTRARPTYSFLMEEGGEVKGTDGQHRWLVDPLDGTTNFLHAIPLFAVSIALERNGELIAGVVFNPVTDELFTAEKGGGAWMNNKRLRVAGRKNLADAVLACGIKLTGTDDDARTLRQVAYLAPSVAGIRRTGSAALDMAWVASGRFDGYWEAGMKPWDIAAGMLLVREAGGFNSDYAGKPNSLVNGEIIAGNELIHTAVQKAIRSVG